MENDMRKLAPVSGEGVSYAGSNPDQQEAKKFPICVEIKKKIPHSYYSAGFYRSERNY